MKHVAIRLGVFILYIFTIIRVDVFHARPAEYKREVSILDMLTEKDDAGESCCVTTLTEGEHLFNLKPREDFFGSLLKLLILA